MPKLYQSTVYRRHVASHPCECGNSSEAHHEAISGRAMRKKVHDTQCVPLCRYCHDRRHKMGSVDFYSDRWPTNDLDYLEELALKGGADAQVVKNLIQNIRKDIIDGHAARWMVGLITGFLLKLKVKK